jgi:hypothetical protein
MATASPIGRGRMQVIAMWFMKGTQLISSQGLGSLSVTWSVAGTGDFNGDGMADIVWREPAATR